MTGAVALDGTNSYVSGSRIYIKVVGPVAKGGLGVYVAGSGTVPDGQVLTNADPFTGSAVVTPPVSADTTPPSVAFTVPASGATLAPYTQVLLTVLANDNVAVQGLTFTDGATGQVIGTGSKNGSTYTLPYTTGAAGPLSLVATATDAAGNSQSATVNATVGSSQTTQPTTTPDAPFPSYDPVTRVLTYQHALGTSELEYNRFGGTFTAYAPIQVDDSSHNAGEWKARVRAMTGRLASGTADSPAIAAKTVTVNQIPVVSAGQQISIQLPTNSVALMGSGSDPDPGDSVASWAWRLVTGPNTPTGLPANTQNLVVSNLIEGTYQIGLRGTDTHGAQSNEAFTVISVGAQSAVATSAPSVTYTSSTRRLTAQHNLAGTLLYSYRGSAFVEYTGAIQVDNVSHSPGDWQFKRAASSGYLESPTAGSPAIAQAGLPDDFALLVVGDSTTTNDYTPFSPTLIPQLNSGIRNNGYPGSFTSTANTGISGLGLTTNPDDSPGGLIGRFNELVAGRYVAGKYNVIVVQCLLNTLAQEVYQRGEAGAAARVLAQLKQLIALIRADNPNWIIIVGTLTPRTNGVQPGQENQRPILNQSIVDGRSNGTLDVQAVAPFGFDTRLSNPGPDPNGTPTTWYKDWVHYSQQADDIVVCPSYRDAFLFARYGIPQPAPFTGAATTNLYLSGYMTLLIAAQTGGVIQSPANSGIYTVGGGAYGDWSRDVLLNKKMQAGSPSRYGLKTAAADALNVIIGLTFENKVVTAGNVYEEYDLSAYRHEDGYLRYKEGKGGTYQIGPKMALGQWPLFDDNGAGLVKVVGTVDGSTFDNLVTFAGNYPQDKYLHMNVEASLGKAYAPQGLGLVDAGAVANPGAGTTVTTYSDSPTRSHSGNWTNDNSTSVYANPNGNGMFTGTVNSYLEDHQLFATVEIHSPVGPNYGEFEIQIDNVRIINPATGTYLFTAYAAVSGKSQLLYTLTGYSAAVNHKITLQCKSGYLLSDALVFKS
jgi:hypothetical protein